MIHTPSSSSSPNKEIDNGAKGGAERNHMEEGEPSITEEQAEQHTFRLPLHIESGVSTNHITKPPSINPDAKLEDSLNEDKDGLIEKLQHQIYQMETQHQTMLQRCQKLETQLHCSNISGNQPSENETMRTKRAVGLGGTETLLQKQLHDEKAAMEAQLKQALQTADNLRDKLTKYRRSFAEDQLVFEDLKGERNQLRQEVAQLKRKSQLIVSIPNRNGFDVASSSLSLLSNNDDDDYEVGESMSLRIGEIQKSSNQQHKEKRQSSIALNDILVIQQLKEERDHLQSELEEAHRQIKQIKTAFKRVQAKDNLIIQELKNERNELREMLARGATRKRKSVSTETTMDESSRQSQLFDENVDDEKELLIQQLKEERVILQSWLERKSQEPKRQEDVIQQLTEERDELRMKLHDSETNSKLENQSSNASLASPSLEGSFQNHHEMIDSSGRRQNFPAQKATTPAKAPCFVSGLPLPPSGTRRSSLTSVSSRSSSAKLNELRAHKHSVETQLKSMVSPHHPKSMIGNLQKELSTNKQIIEEQKFLLHQSQTKQKSHERIIAEQKIQLRLLANKIKQGISDQRTSWSRSKRAQRLDRWKNRMQQDIEEKFDALLEQYSRQLDIVDREYDVRTYTVAERHLPDGNGLFFWVKVLFIFLLWNFRS